MSGFTPPFAAARRFIDAAAGLLFPPHCAHCARPLQANRILCFDCRLAAERIHEPFCISCSEPFPGGADDFVCAQCETRHFHFQCAVSAFRFRGVAREIIHRIKYGREFWLRRQASFWLLQAFRDFRLLEPPASLLVPVPLHALRLRERGFNQAAAIAEITARHLQLPCKSVLRRIRYTETQTGFDRRRRISNLRGAFVVRDHAPVHDQHCVLVDDVFTTGSTLDACARELLAAGAASVRCAIVARG